MALAVSVHKSCIYIKENEFETYKFFSSRSNILDTNRFLNAVFMPRRIILKGDFIFTFATNKNVCSSLERR